MAGLIKLSGRLALLGAGILLAVALSTGSHAADTTTTDTTTTVATTETTTETTVPTETVVTTTTVGRTTIVRVPSTTTSAESTDNGTESWVWVLLAILGVALVVLIVLLARRGGGGGAVPVEDRRRQLEAAVGSWSAQGWAIETQTDDSAVLRRGGEAMLVSVDQAGHVSTRPLPGS